MIRSVTEEQKVTVMFGASFTDNAFAALTIVVAPAILPQRLVRAVFRNNGLKFRSSAQLLSCLL